MSHYDLYIFELPMTKQSSIQFRTTLQPRYVNNQLQVNSILHLLIIYNTFILLSLRQEPTFPRQWTWFHWGAMEPIPGDLSWAVILCLATLSSLLNQAEHFIKHDFQDLWHPFTDNLLSSINFISMSHLNNVWGDIIFNFQFHFKFHSQGYQYCMSQYHLPPGHDIHAASLHPGPECEPHFDVLSQ